MPKRRNDVFPACGSHHALNASAPASTCGVRACVHRVAGHAQNECSRDLEEPIPLPPCPNARHDRSRRRKQSTRTHGQLPATPAFVLIPSLLEVVEGLVFTGFLGCFRAPVCASVSPDYPSGGDKTRRRLASSGKAHSDRHLTSSWTYGAAYFTGRLLPMLLETGRTTSTW